MKRFSSKQAKAKSISTALKMTVYKRDNGRCVYCGRPGNPEAHFISRSKGGLGVPENIITLCRSCHRMFDQGTREEREGMREYLMEYLMSKYPKWDEKKLIYHKYKEDL